jgi:hypothetical protein
LDPDVVGINEIEQLPGESRYCRVGRGASRRRMQQEGFRPHSPNKTRDIDPVKQYFIDIVQGIMKV